MSRSKITGWELQLAREIEEFSRGWDWGSVFRTWKERITDFSVEIVPLFHVIRIKDQDGAVRRRKEITWWPTNRAERQELHLKLQEDFDRWPGMIGDFSPGHVLNKGEIYTAIDLFSIRESEESVCALLILASLFSRMHSSRSRYPRESWPKYSCVSVLEDFAQERMSEEIGCRFRGWHDACTTVIPFSNSDWDCKIESMRALVRYLAEEHAALLLQYRPTLIVFSKTEDREIRKILDRKYEIEQAELKAFQERREKSEQLEQKRVERKKEKHPRFGEFDRVSIDELERLVWSKPMSELAKEFGISDVAIAKRCKKLAVARPGRGFWARVRAGKTPHPNGKPTTT